MARAGSRTAGMDAVNITVANKTIVSLKGGPQFDAGEQNVDSKDARTQRGLRRAALPAAFILQRLGRSQWYRVIIGSMLCASSSSIRSL